MHIMQYQNPYMVGVLSRFGVFSCGSSGVIALPNPARAGRGRRIGDYRKWRVF